jgi:hypothetical protein
MFGIVLAVDNLLGEGNMLDSSWPGWGLMQSVIAAISGLGGVVVGSFMTARNQKADKKRERIQQQLREFYSPLLGMHQEIKAKSELRPKVHAAANVAWQKLFIGAADGMEKEEIDVKNKARFDKVLEYSNEQLEKDLIPTYQRMLKLYTNNLWLAEDSTQGFGYVLTEFVELWNRYFSDALPREVLNEIEHTEEKLKPFYKDLQDNFERLSKELCS